MMWIDGVNPVMVLDAYVAAVVALFVCGIPAALQQHKYAPILKDAKAGAHMAEFNGNARRLYDNWMRVAREAVPA